MFLKERALEWVGMSFEDCFAMFDLGWQREFGSHFVSGLCALEMAILDLKTKALGVSLGSYLRSQQEGIEIKAFLENRFECDITVPALSEKEAVQFLKKLSGHGFRSFKVKVTGADLAADRDRVLVTQQFVPKGGQITLDGNQGFDVSGAIALCRTLEDLGIEVSLFEQPHPKEDWKAFVALAQELACPVCLDESVKKRSDLEKALSFGLPFWLNLKIMKSGIRETYLLGNMAKGSGVPLMIGGMVESDLAMTCSLQVLQALGGVDIVDLDTPFFLESLVSKNSAYSAASSILEVADGPGLGLDFHDFCFLQPLFSGSCS